MARAGSQEIKERQSLKIKELSDALVAAGFVSLDEQATALGLSRSTTWTILKAKHKNYGLSGALVSRILQKQGLDRRVRAKIIEYVEEKASGHYGHNQTQLRRFKDRILDRAVHRKMLIELKATANKTILTPKKRDTPSRSLASRQI
jgi:hypothetical protein